VGLNSPATCAAIRENITNPSETRFIDEAGEPILAHQVPIGQPWRGRKRLVKMAAMAIEECLAAVARERWREVPLLLCVAERERPGRVSGLEEELFAEIERELGVEFLGSPDELILRGTLADIAPQVKAAGLVRTAVIIVGRTLGAEQFRDSHLYSPERDRHVC
jgi:3-oxoacyl-[acyl-carrier-protein] synthase-1